MFSHGFRGVQVDEEEEKRLNKLGGNILRETGLDFPEWKDYDWILQQTEITNQFFHGYAEYYLYKCWNESKWINEADAKVYQGLIDIDSKLGTELSQQLWACLNWTTRWDIIKV